MGEKRLDYAHLERELARLATGCVDEYLTAYLGSAPVATIEPSRDKQVTQVALNYEEMEAMHQQYGTRGVYAYLIERGIAKDKTHGDFIIEDIFMPEYTKRHGAQLRLVR